MESKLRNSLDQVPIITVAATIISLKLSLLLLRGPIALSENLLTRCRFAALVVKSFGIAQTKDVSILGMSSFNVSGACLSMPGPIFACLATDAGALDLQRGEEIQGFTIPPVRCLLQIFHGSAAVARVALKNLLQLRTTAALEPLVFKNFCGLDGALEILRQRLQGLMVVEDHGDYAMDVQSIRNEVHRNFYRKLEEVAAKLVLGSNLFSNSLLVLTTIVLFSLTKRLMEMTGKAKGWPGKTEMHL
ncbi:hypothetical protein ACFX13_002701 [Malus domestica]|uniref:Uncharacterized protein n=1 Tax=Malus domestica TaxID=3750 RepID=A0A498J218_MALDO|nr:hypothetical protein DVH24_037667 [Malus domestica]